MPPLCPRLFGSVEEELNVGVRKNDGPDVASFEHGPAARGVSKVALQLQELLPDDRPRRHDARAAADLRRADRVGHVFAAEKHAVAAESDAQAGMEEAAQPLRSEERRVGKECR